MSQSTGSYGAFPPSSIVSTLEAKRNCKCYSGSRFIDVVTIGQRVAKRDIEGELVADLPNQSDQPRKRLATNSRCRSRSTAM
jgi:hypothetical protein